MVVSVNLRHDEYGRRILELHEKQFLPLDTIMTFKTIRRLSTNPSDLLEAVDVANETSNGESPSMQLFTAESENGQVLVGRAPIFNYELSYRRSLERMMIIEGWPGDQFDTRWAEARVRSLLLKGIADPRTISRSDPRTSLQPIPVAYWRRDVPRGLLTIEFLEEEGALQAWENIDRFADVSSESFQIHSIPTSESRYVNVKDRLYRFDLNGWDLLARPMELSPEEERALLAAIPSRTTPDIIRTEADLENELHSELHDHEAELKNMDNDVVSRVEEYTATGHAPSLHQLTSKMDDLHQRHKQLPAPSRDWLHEYRRMVSQRSISTDIVDQSTEEEAAMREKLFQEVAVLISGSQLSVSSGIIRGMGSKDSYLLSDALGKAMEVFSETPVLTKRGQSRAERISPFDSCLNVLDTLKSLNLDIHPFHYACAVRAACHESRFDDAARIFLSQIDDDSGVGGYVPIEASFDWDHPLLIGMYAVARDSQYASMDAISTADTVSHSQAVFETAKKLSMISPTNHDTCKLSTSICFLFSKSSYILHNFPDVLAGGIALGRAGLWYDCLDFVTNQEGQVGCYWPAAMLACLESSRSAEAVDLYEYFRDPEKNAASEWQWSGGRSESVSLLCRDLALQAMGNVAAGGHSKYAISLFREIMSDDSPMSMAALVGVARSLEYDGDWQTSIQLLDTFLESIDKGNSNWRLVTDSLHLMDASKARTAAPAELDVALFDLLFSVMRCCNNSKQFGMAVLLCSVVGSRGDDRGLTTSTSAGDTSSIVNRILSQSIVSHNKWIRESYLHSLIGLGCAGLASDIASRFEEDLYVHKRNNAPRGETAISAITSMSRVNAAMYEIQLREQEEPSHEGIEILLRGLGRAMSHLIDSRQPAAALYFYCHVKTQLEALDGQRVDTFTEQVKTYFHSSESRMDFQLSSLPWQQDKLLSKGMSDSIMSSLIDAHRDMGHPDKAREIFADFRSSNLDHPVPMPQSANSYANVLLDHDSVDECMDFLKSLDRDSINPSTFLSLARALSQRGLWSEIGKLYNSAHKAGCLSEELALIAIQAVCESELLNGKILVLRDIVNDASNMAGIKNKDWIAERYWRLKRYAGHHYARVSVP